MTSTATTGNDTTADDEPTAEPDAGHVDSDTMDGKVATTDEEHDDAGGQHDDVGGQHDDVGSQDGDAGGQDGGGKRGRLGSWWAAVRGIRWRSPVTRLAALSVLLLIITAVAGTGWYMAHNDAASLRQHAQLRGSALHAARQYAVDLTTYDYQHLDKQQQKLNAESTEKFQQTFAKSSESLAPIFDKLKASAEGTVVDAAVRNVSDSQAVVLLFVNQVAKSTKLDEPQNQASRLRMHLARNDDRWLLDKVDLVP